MLKPKRCLLVVLDGWGVRAEREANAILLAGTPNIDALVNRYPHSQLQTSGEAVGLPDGQMGNSEVGHTNLGAGRVVYQDFVRINRAIADGSLFSNDALTQAMDRVKASSGALHLLGLVSDGGVHSHTDHAIALVEMAKKRGLKKVFLHVFTDGRDTPPTSGEGYVSALESKLSELSEDGFSARIASVAGRYWAMDRDQRWDRVESAWRTVVMGEGHQASSGTQLVQAAYARGEGDEFIEPGVIAESGEPIGRIQDGDGAIFFNFRADRAREMTSALAVEDFDGFMRPVLPKLVDYVCMTSYAHQFSFPVAYEPNQPTEIFPELVSKKGWYQFRCAETEKYAHVTFFFNGGQEAVFPGETRELVASPRDVKTYDLKPEMSARQVTDAVIRALPENEFVLMNLANPDMVGHSGVLPAAMEAVKVVDECIGRLWEACRKQDVVLLVTADHGNVEMMVDPVTGQPHTAHTTGPVPFIAAHEELVGYALVDGILADVAPTLCELMGLEPSSKMSGRSLLRNRR